MTVAWPVQAAFVMLGRFSQWSPPGMSPPLPVAIIMRHVAARLETTMIRSVLSALGLIVALAGMGLFAGAGAYVWTLRAETLQQTEMLAERAHAAGDVAEEVIRLIREIIARAQAGLAAARTDPAKLTAGKEPDPLVRFALAKAKRDLPHEVERARDAVSIASEALVVAGAAVDVFEERPGDGSSLGIRPEDMRAARMQLDTAANELGSARSILGIPIPSDGSATPEQLTQVEDALQRAEGVADQMDGALAQARAKVNHAREQVESWSLRVAIGITAAAILAALGQFFMARACWYGLRAA